MRRRDFFGTFAFGLLLSPYAAAQLNGPGKSSNQESYPFGTEYDWTRYARPEQLQPSGKWNTWIIAKGAGWGKSRACTEWIRLRVETGEFKSIGLVCEDYSDLRELVCSQTNGLTAICPPWNKPVYSESRQSVVWTNPNCKSYNAHVDLYLSENLDSMRGLSHDGIVLHDLAMYRCADYIPLARQALRVHKDAKIVVATYPSISRCTQHGTTT